MSQDWQLSELLTNLHGDVQHQLGTVRKSFQHPVIKGDGTENVWIELFNQYLPKRYRASRAFVVDSNNQFSDQMDVVIFDRQYSPLIFHYAEQLIIPAESIYAVFEVKQTLNKKYLEKAQEHVQSVRKLHRTNLPVPHAGGTYPPRPLKPILGGILTLENEIQTETLQKHLEPSGDPDSDLSMGCAADNCFFFKDLDRHQMVIKEHAKATTAFLFELLSQLQKCATVPMIDIHAYGKWL